MKDKEISEQSQKVVELKKSLMELNGKLLDVIKEDKDKLDAEVEKNNQIKLALKELENVKDRIIQKHEDYKQRKEKEKVEQSNRYIALENDFNILYEDFVD